jgi:hypothetical protein
MEILMEGEWVPVQGDSIPGGFQEDDQGIL